MLQQAVPSHPATTGGGRPIFHRLGTLHAAIGKLDQFDSDAAGGASSIPRRRQVRPHVVPHRLIDDLAAEEVRDGNELHHRSGVGMDIGDPRPGSGLQR